MVEDRGQQGRSGLGFKEKKTHQMLGGGLRTFDSTTAAGGFVKAGQQDDDEINMVRISTIYDTK